MTVQRKSVNKKFTIDCQQPASDKIFDVSAFEKFLHDRIKVEGKTGNLGKQITIAVEKNKVVVHAHREISKRYLKYLTKKFLKKNLLRDYLHVIASDKYTYQLRYFNINAEEAKEEATA